MTQCWVFKATEQGNLISMDTGASLSLTAGLSQTVKTWTQWPQQEASRCSVQGRKHVISWIWNKKMPEGLKCACPAWRWITQQEIKNKKRSKIWRFYGYITPQGIGRTPGTDKIRPPSSFLNWLVNTLLKPAIFLNTHWIFMLQICVQNALQSSGGIITSLLWFTMKSCSTYAHTTEK